MTIAHVQHTQAQNGQSSSARTLAFPSNVTAGNALIACVGFYGTSTGTIAVTDSLSQTWSSAVLCRGNGAANLNAQIFYFFNTAGGANTVTFTPTASVYTALIIAEFSGLVGTLGNTANAANAGSIINILTGGVTPPVLPNLGISLFTTTGTNLSWCLPDGGYSQFGLITGGGSGCGAAAYFKIDEQSNYGCISTQSANCAANGCFAFFS